MYFPRDIAKINSRCNCFSQAKWTNLENSLYVTGHHKISAKMYAMVNDLGFFVIWDPARQGPGNCFVISTTRSTEQESCAGWNGCSWPPQHEHTNYSKYPWRSMRWYEVVYYIPPFIRSVFRSQSISQSCQWAVYQSRTE